MGGAPCVIVEK
jgi:hypothetical protein